MKNEHAHLKGTEVWVRDGKFHAKAFVADIDKNKGITIKTLDTQEDLICLNRKSSYLFQIGKTYQDVFDWYVKAILQGEVDVKVKDNKFSIARPGLALSPCAFE